jgi:hypothetical protein
MKKLSLSFIALCFVFLHFLFAIESKCDAWGFNFISYFSTWSICCFYVLAIIVCIPLFKLKFPSLKDKTSILVMIGVLSFLYFYYVKFKYGFVGDNYLHVGQVERGDFHAVGNGEGSAFVMCLFYKVVHSLLNLNGFKTIQLFSAICGIGYSIYTFLIAEELGKNVFERTTIFLVCMLLPLSSQFNGLIEVHALPIVLSIAFYYYLILAFKRKIPIFVPVCILIFSAFFHFMVLTCLPAIVFLFIYRLQKSKQIQIVIMLFIICLFATLVFWPKIFHPLTDLNDGRFTVFSIQNLTEFFNGQVLGLGSLLFGLVVCLINIKKIKINSEMLLFLSIAVFQLVFFLCFDSLLGRNNWELDIFPAYACALTIMLALFQLKQICNYVLKIIIGLMILHSGYWMLINTSDLSIKWFKNNTINDEAYYYKTHRAELVMAMTFESNGLAEKAEEYYKLNYYHHLDDPRCEFSLGMYLTRKYDFIDANFLFADIDKKFPGFLQKLKIKI